jgi:SCY1-like protein 1
MTSLEHESNDTSVSASDYGAADNWDQENWGDMDVSILFYFIFYMYKRQLILF